MPLDPQNSVVGTSCMYVNITLPSLTGSGSLLSNLILTGTDVFTGGGVAAAPNTGKVDSIIGVVIKNHTGTYYYGGATTTGNMQVTVASGVNSSEPAINWHLVTYVKSSTANTMAVTAVCILK